ncbi:MAG: ribosome biogenesis GTP-binding protein YihA/YsxC [Acidobacteriota bacterium]|nr:ribosome biogenesis GTP-binding protein YihA/YsxC [Acidobacteriota bacterium]
MKVQTARFIRSAVRSEDFLRDGLPEVAFAGRSNVGKSTLLNRLVGRKGLARISSTPGRTRAINYFLINSRFYFVDLPGYGYAKVSKSERKAWAALMDQYLGRTSGDAKVFQLVDGKVGATPLDVQATEYLVSLGIVPAVVATKIDKISRNKRPSQLAAIRRELAMAEDASLIAFSALSGEGVREIWKEIESYFEHEQEPNEDER